MVICLNGLTQQYPQQVTLLMLIEQHYGARPGMAVALNNEVIPASAWATTEVKPRDRIDVFQAVAGG